jgi:TP901 family phage tail tape measure protein
MAATEVAELSIYFFRQGRSAQDALEMTRVAAESARVASIDATESANYLTSAINGFELAASDAENVADRFAKLGAASASSYDELARAMSKVAPSAKSSGVDIDHMMGFLAKGIETTREAPQNIGTAFKTIFARMQELSDFSKTLEDGVNVNRVEKALGTVGVELRNTMGIFRPAQEIIMDLGEKWDGLDRNMQSYLATIMAGIRQQPRLLALMNNFTRTQELVTKSQSAAGEMAIQHASYLEGLEGSVQRLRNA